MSQLHLHKLQLRIEHPIDVLEDQAYSIKYYLRNIGNQDFPGGLIKFRLKYPHWGETYSVIHDWDLGVIKRNDEKPLEPKPIKAVSGPNVFVFLYVASNLNNQFVEDVKFVDSHDNEISKGTLVGYLRVKSLEEKHSERNIKIALFSLVLLITTQVFDWVFQLWLSEKICIQNMIMTGFVFVGFLLIFYIWEINYYGRGKER